MTIKSRRFSLRFNSEEIYNFGGGARARRDNQAHGRARTLLHKSPFHLRGYESRSSDKRYQFKATKSLLDLRLKRHAARLRVNKSFLSSKIRLREAAGNNNDKKKKSF